MKRTGPELGDLSSRFFAYVQLKEKDVVTTGEMSTALGITETQEHDLLRRMADTGWIVRLKRGAYLVPSRIPAGGKYSPGIPVILKKLIEENGGVYQLCGPSAFNYFGFDDQVPNVTYLYNNRISGQRTVGNKVFKCIKTSTMRLGETIEVDTADGIQLVYSSRARTLMDAVYDWSRFNSLPRGFQWIRDDVTRNPDLAIALVDSAVRFGNQATVRRIGYLFDIMALPLEITERLRKTINKSKSTIPWIPGKKARGKVDQKWGVIVNG
jgi:predicted transcriptional regulator of viral defense system